ncbi:uncharacterized protein LOC129920577 [Episyrphus balteatus]|uniref:uncharacterized protein LOC129920577 n=1 Tax=Episyrphus balteatus TaxID=286459 RepID=UPI002484E61C|nr:uncharacterized protein LOC129920577 [Episyrphus balteatus]
MFSLFRFVIIIILTYLLTTVINGQRSQRNRLRLCSMVNVPNALVRFKHNFKIMRINCVTGFSLQGSNIVACENGKWNAETPVCTKEGCPKHETPQNGLIMPTRHKANLYCTDKYKLVGGKVTYCNGTHWDRPLGKCEETNDKIQLACDFESDDLCGWSHDETHNFDWKRIMAANLFQQLRTGPQHDHTTFTADAGHYMLMESFDQQPHNVARLISPIYSKTLTNNYGCFKFFYFMYGAAVGSLNVYVKPVSVDLEEVLQETRYKYFGISGNQKNIWKEGLFIIKQLPEDFQIIIEGTAGINHLSDIAIDDIELMQYSKCSSLSSTGGVTRLPDFTDYAIYDVQSCEGRCSEISPSNFGITNKEGVFYKSCDCHEECESLNTCCPNYRSVCEFGSNGETTSESLDSATNLPLSMLNYTKIIPTTITTSLTSTTTTTTTPPPTTQTKTTPSSTTPTTSTTKTTKTTKVSTYYNDDGSRLSTSSFVKTKKSETETERTTTTTPTTITTTTAKSSTSTLLISTELGKISTKIRNAEEEPTILIENSTKILETTSAQPTYSQDDRIHLNIITSQSIPTTENVLISRKDKIITWQIPKNKFKRQKDNNDSNSITLNLTLFVVITLIVSLAIKHYKLIKNIKQRHINRFLKKDHEDATVLIYNQDDELL